jgi:uncharacterized iron-regulated membrane protein
MSTRNPTLQQTLRSLHLWLGLMGGLLIVMMGLTGTIAVLRPLVESTISPSAHSRSPVSRLAPVEQGFATAHPGARITRVSIPEQTPAVILIQAETTGKKHFEVYFDAASGQELGPRRTVGWLEWIVDLHQNLLLGRTGRSLSGTIGFALLLSARSGLLAWLAGAREWKRGLALPASGPWRRTSYELHRWAGLWANVLLLTVSITGIVLAYPDSFQQAVRMATHERQAMRGNRKIKPKTRNCGSRATFGPLCSRRGRRGSRRNRPRIADAQPEQRSCLCVPVGAGRYPPERRQRRAAQSGISEHRVRRAIDRQAFLPKTDRACQRDPQNRAGRIGIQARMVVAGRCAPASFRLWCSDLVDAAPKSRPLP